MKCKRNGSAGNWTNDLTPDESKHYLCATTAARKPFSQWPDSLSLSRQLQSPVRPTQLQRVITRSVGSFCNFDKHIREQYSMLFLMTLPLKFHGRSKRFPSIIRLRCWSEAIPFRNFGRFRYITVGKKDMNVLRLRQFHLKSASMGYLRR